MRVQCVYMIGDPYHFVVLTSFMVMPISLEQWRATVGINNAASAGMLAKCSHRRKKCTGLCGPFLSFLAAALFAPSTELDTGYRGKTTN